MGASFIQVNYDALKNVAKRFGQEAGTLDETHRGQGVKDLLNPETAST